MHRMQFHDIYFIYIIYIYEIWTGQPHSHDADVRLKRYAILEIKLQDVSEAPLWLRQTLNDIGAKLACLVSGCTCIWWLDVIGKPILWLYKCGQCINGSVAQSVLGMKSGQWDSMPTLQTAGPLVTPTRPYPSLGFLKLARQSRFTSSPNSSCWAEVFCSRRLLCLLKWPRLTHLRTSTNLRVCVCGCMCGCRCVGARAFMHIDMQTWSNMHVPLPACLPTWHTCMFVVLMYLRADVVTFSQLKTTNRGWDSWPMIWLNNRLATTTTLLWHQHIPMLSNVSGVGLAFCKACNGISSSTACPYVAALAQRLRRMAQSKGQKSKILDTLRLKPRGCFVLNCFLKELMCMTKVGIATCCNQVLSKAKGNQSWHIISWRGRQRQRDGETCQATE